MKSITVKDLATLLKTEIEANRIKGVPPRRVKKPLNSYKSLARKLLKDMAKEGTFSVSGNKEKTYTLISSANPE